MPPISHNVVEWSTFVSNLLCIPGAVAAVAHLVYAWRRDRAAQQRPVAEPPRTTP